MFKSPLFWKVFTLVGCIALLLVPLMMVSNLVKERSDYRDEVADVLRQSSAGSQKLIGPLIAVPVTEITTVLESTGDEPPKEIRRSKSFIRYWLPESLMIEAKQQVESRQIGIYDGQVWHGDISLKAQFDPKRLGLEASENLKIGEPFVVLALSDARGIGQVQTMKINGETLTVEPGSGLVSNMQGLHAPLGSVEISRNPLMLDMSFSLNGTGALSVVPVGRNSELTLLSDWPHPRFTGDFLPTKREVSASGFQAHWQSTWFANNIDSKVRDMLSLSEGNEGRLPAFSVNITTPADQYQLTDRAIKYAILLIALIFAAFFVFESLTARQMHPMEYLLVGLSLVMFYLVLLALSEHIGFTPAWITASLLGGFINGFYLQGVMKTWRASLPFTGALLTLYGVMWCLLNSEDSALLLGTGVLFVALSAMMILTRRFDWYSISMVRKSSVARSEPTDEGMRLWK
ncbi:cell envelope integrity protein CreD [Yokenella regensburgei]|uniref:cell envelope integrity protein CreD n=1 Tax=Yokenella regensburgei TaxID=158877 RepID=UPI003F1830C8